MVRRQIRKWSFSFVDWNVHREDQYSIAYRPSLNTLLRRLVVSALAGLIAALVSYGFHSTFGVFRSPAEIRPVDEVQRAELQQTTDRMLDELRRTMTPEEWEQFQTDLAQRDAERESRVHEAHALENRVRTFVTVAYGTVMTGLLLCALLPPVSTLWQQITIARTPSQLVVRSRGLWPRTRSVPIAEYRRIRITAREIRYRPRPAAASRSAGYRWCVSLEPNIDPLLGSGDVWILEFQPHWQKERPIEQMRLPERVSRLSDALKRMTGVEPDPFIVVEFRGEVISSLGTRRYVMSGPAGERGTRIVESGPVVQQRTYSFDEMPPEFRRQVEEMLARGQTSSELSVVRTSTVPPGDAPKMDFTFRDADGNVHHYRSLDEMPPNIRALFEQVKNSGLR